MTQRQISIATDEATTYRPLATIPKRAGIEVRIRIGQLGGSPFIDVREFHQVSATSEEWRGTARGITLPISATSALVDAVLRLEATTRSAKPHVELSNPGGNRR